MESKDWIKRAFYTLPFRLSNVNYSMPSVITQYISLKTSDISTLSKNFTLLLFFSLLYPSSPNITRESYSNSLLTPLFSSKTDEHS